MKELHSNKEWLAEEHGIEEVSNSRSSPGDKWFISLYHLNADRSLC